MSGTIVITHAEITGGSIAIEPEYHRFDGCHFQRVNIWMTKSFGGVFSNCYFKDCILDENTVKAILLGGGNIVERSTNDAKVDV